MELLVITLLASCEDYPNDMDKKTNPIMIQKVSKDEEVLAKTANSQSLTIT